jgi:hypothetical protein
MKRKSICAAGTVLVMLGWAGAARALDPDVKCEVGKNKIAGKYAYCRQKAEAKALATGTSADYSKCDEVFADKWSKTETSADGACPTNGDMATIESCITMHTDNIAAALRGGTCISGGSPTASTPTSMPTQTPMNTPTSVRTPTFTPAPVAIALSLFINQACDNGDGTASTAVSALVTASGGVAVGDGTPVYFSFGAGGTATPGTVSITSPGYTGQAAPCDLSCLALVPQPGNAQACLSFSKDQGLRTVVINASANWGMVYTMSFITLPNPIPPTPTPTPTNTPALAPANIQLSLASALACDNNDGTATMVIAALVTDGSGVAVNGAKVLFSLSNVSPAGTASVTSPSVTGGPVPCSVSCISPVAQPGDALSCIKYLLDGNDPPEPQDTSVDVTATVQGTTITDTTTVTLLGP